MATTAEAAICNVALLRIGQRQPITDLDPANDASANAAICAVLYPVVRDRLLQRSRWGFATRSAILVPDDNLDSEDPLVAPGWAYTYLAPTGMLAAQYIFNGARPGQPGTPYLTGVGVFGFPNYYQGALVAGAIPQVAFEHIAGHIFTDWTDDPTLYDSTVFYTKNAVVTDGAGNYYRSRAAANQGNALTNTGFWGPTTDSSNALLVYTLDDTSAADFNPLFTDTLQWALAAELALSVASKPELAAEFSKQADAALRIALANEGNAREPDPQPVSSYISGRG